MKSALELAMEKTAKLVSREDAGLSEDQKKRIAQVEAEFRARVAEAEIMRDQKIRKARAGDPAEAAAAIQALQEGFLKDKEAWEAKRNREIAKVKGERS